MYYFAYGSSMNFDHMRRLCGRRFTVVGPAVLRDFEFGLDTRGYVNIRQNKGKEVFGVLYSVDQECMNILDEYEGYPNVFNRIEVELTDFDKVSYKAWVYLEKPEEFGGPEVKPEHLNMIIAGATANHLPAEWINFLESFKKNANG